MTKIIDAQSVTEHDDTLKQILQETRSIAVVGLSPQPHRTSHRIAAYLLGKGYRVIPVNPGHDTILDQPAYSNLDQIPGEVDLVNVFRRSEYVPDIVRESIEKKARILWLQEGVIHPQAALEAASAGLKVVMDRCIYREHQRIMMGIPLGRILADFRIRQRRTLEEVAERLAISPKELEAIEKASDEDLTSDTVQRIAAAIQGE